MLTAFVTSHAYAFVLVCCLLLADTRNNQALETDIVQACGGMPLALEVAGGHLGMNCTYMDWKVSRALLP
jgi:hypothetical protein